MSNKALLYSILGGELILIYMLSKHHNDVLRAYQEGMDEYISYSHRWDMVNLYKWLPVERFLERFKKKEETDK